MSEVCRTFYEKPRASGRQLNCFVYARHGRELMRLKSSIRGSRYLVLRITKVLAEGKPPLPSYGVSRGRRCEAGYDTQRKPLRCARKPDGKTVSRPVCVQRTGRRTETPYKAESLDKAAQLPPF